MPAELAESPQQVDQSNELEGFQPGQGDGSATANVEVEQDSTKQAVAELLRMETARQQREAKPVEKEPTPEEQAKLWGIYDPESEDKDFFSKFLRLNTDMDEAERAKAIEAFKPLFAAMQKGLVRQAIIGSRNLLTQEMDKRFKEYEPVKQFATEAQAEKERTKFFDSYPALSDERFRKVLGAAAHELSTQSFKDKDEYYKALAESAAETIKTVLPDFDLGTKPQKQGAKAPAGQAPRLPRMNAGGTGGAGAGKQKSDDGGRNDDSSSLF